VRASVGCSSSGWNRPRRPAPREIKICVSGRLGGAEIARQEKATTGSVPLTTLQADVNYGYAIAFTTYGTIGVKAWIYRGMYGEEVLETDVRPGGPCAAASVIDELNLD
jgi:small subunit ribosomal protein S3